MPPRAPRSPLLAALASLASLALLTTSGGCSAPDTNDLTVNPSIINPSLKITPSQFGTKDEPQGVLSGSFTLMLSLGTLASDPVDVDVQILSLVRASDQYALLPQVAVGSNSPTSFHLEPGDTKENIYNLKYEKPVVIADLCKAGQIQYTGAVLDRKRNKSIPIDGATFSPEGCP